MLNVYNCLYFGGIAQPVEQGTHKPCVPSSTLGPATKRPALSRSFFVPSTKEADFLLRHDKCDRVLSFVTQTHGPFRYIQLLRALGSSTR